MSIRTPPITTKKPFETTYVDNLLGQYVDLLDKKGSESREVREFLDRHQADGDFPKLAKTVHFVWKQGRAIRH